MFSIHAFWSTSNSLFLWGEDSELLSKSRSTRKKDAKSSKPSGHPFAASVDQISHAVAGSGSQASLLLALASKADIWLPSTSKGPDPSPKLKLASYQPYSNELETTKESFLSRWNVPVLGFAAEPALDVLLALSLLTRSEILLGDSVTLLSSIASLALEIVAGGRFLPDLMVDDTGRGVAGWTALDGGQDEARIQSLIETLPSVTRAEVVELAGESRNAKEQDFHDTPTPTPSCMGSTRLQCWQSADHLVRSALAAMVDVLCRESFSMTKRASSKSLKAPSKRVRSVDRKSTGTTTALQAWVSALGPSGPIVDLPLGEVVQLARRVEQWRTAGERVVGPWRLCFRLSEPHFEADDQPQPQPQPQLETNVGAESEIDTHLDLEEPASKATWRLDFLLQATQDLSLLIPAEQVWQAGVRIEHGIHALDAPHERILSELGRAMRSYPSLEKALNEPAPVGIDLDIDGAYNFLSAAAIELEMAGFGVLLPAWWRQPGPRLGVRLRVSMLDGANLSDSSNPSDGESGTGVSSGLLDVGVLCSYNWEAALGDQTISEAELRELAARKVPLVQMRGQWVELAGGKVDRLLEYLTKSNSNEQKRAISVKETLQLATRVPRAIEDLEVVAIDAKGWLGGFLRGEIEDVFDVQGTPAGFFGKLRPYQEKGMAWLDLLGRLGLGACLADDMGLGKTATVLAAMLVERERPTVQTSSAQPLPGPTLVICPTSVVGNWKREAEKFTPSLNVYLHHGAKRAKVDSFATQVAGVDLVITSYQLATRDKSVLSKISWGRLVLDEAQAVKNPLALQTRAIRTFNARSRVALTGTPVENHLGELWSIMDVLNPGLLGSGRDFREKFAIPIERYRDEEAAKRLRRMTSPFMLRRLKTDRSVIADLPEKFEIKTICNLTREQATLYQAVVDDMLARIDDSTGIERKGLVLATMMRLKQVCNHPAHFLADSSPLAGRSGKLERTIEILYEVLECGERALVFTQFATMGSMLHADLQARLGQRVAFLHGGVSRQDRDSLVAEFQESQAMQIMILSLKAGGTGLNLTAANHVLHFDRWWNPAVENQATDRAFRIGQRRDVQVRKLICAGTLEEKIDEMIEKKKDLADSIVGSGEGWLGDLSTDELANLFQLSDDAMSGES